MGKIVIALRWLAILPAWVLANIIVSIFFMLVSGIVYGYTGNPDSSVNSYLMSEWITIINFVACGVVGIYTVATIAPCAKRETSFVVASIAAMLLALGLIILGTQWHAKHMSTGEAIHGFLQGAPSVIAGFVTAAKVPHRSTDGEIADCGKAYLKRI